ncbi:MAG: hypothetical protein A2Y45_06465 [Tenericutes bacterium GWC2_34_14]|nr:MAG: hypothetical protein A2Z84_03410 [Tenericutes bacterium GWA2_35_7]OHE28597.1 MAG: hypothetical protein A2Y45_06465 [Tenericutes bacterium GWC2_34_14]OHE33495.1 MAG: hypothetical protein A2012_03345 [Tenericutes bacterium GWE2_34_108]OHE36780.1 MAG: hypothetical protein A2Y46_09145 [Tenericutes bacterium GWF1_35_14]OHE38140.1 MAG: hypothetical protein A2Y44_09520 [Tenericutes bacterium GWF2_35_184]OHE43343.1 MAG: hypothetical protein A2221_06215 [Tenericutes bacterium RIFOXYA2_FULL_36_3
MINVLLSRGILGSQMLVEELKDVIKKEHKVAILLYSFFDHEFRSESDYQINYEKGSEYYVKMVNSFSPYGIGEDQLLFINYYQDTKESAIKKIKEADILYFPGGAPDQMMRRIKEKGIQEAIESHKKIYIGSSAGAMIQFKDYYISIDADYPSFRYEEGLDLLKGFFLETHYRRRKTQKAGMRKVFRAHKMPIITCPDDGAVVVYDNEIILLGTSKLYYDHHGVSR